MKLATLSVLLLLLPALLVSGSGVARGQAGFTGTWLDSSKRIVYTISGEGSSLSGSYQYNLAGAYHKNARGSGSFSNCRTEDDVVICDWTGSHEDDDKTLSQRGIMKLKLSGDYLTVTTVHIDDSSTVNWKPGAHQYDPEIGKGYYHTVQLERSGEGPEQPEESCPLAASLKNCEQPLELRPGAPSKVCEVCISGWCRNTANPVRVILPQQSDWWGSNAPGIVVFAGGREEPPDDPIPTIISPMTVEPSNMSGYRCWDSPFETYPWNLFVRARETAPAGPVVIPIEVRQRIPGTDRDAVVNLTMQLMVLSGGQRTGQLVPLKLFWSAARGDNFTTATPEGENAALAAGYTFVRIEGYVYPTQQPDTVPLKLYYSNSREDNYTTGVAQGEQAAQAANYGYVRVEGYIYPAQQPGTVPLKNYWNSSREDNFTTATSDGERDALGSGYQFAWVEGYVLPSDSGSTGGTMAGKYAIQTVNGNYLNAVNGGGEGGADAIHTDATKIDAWETFNLIPLDDGKYAIQTVNGNYLTAVNGGGMVGPGAIHTDATKIDAWERFTLQNLGGDAYAIQTINGNYLTALNGGGIGGGQVTIHTDATKIDAWETFKLIKLGQ